MSYTTVMSSPIEKLKTEFLEYLEVEKNRSQKTVRNYDFYLTRFFRIARIAEPSDITLASVKKFRLWLHRFEQNGNGASLGTRTQNYHVIALRTFLKYCAKNDIATLATEKIELAKEPDRQVEFLEQHELRELLAAPLRNEHGERIAQPTIMMMRDKAIIELFFSTGLRVAELATLQRDGINLAKDEFTVRGKGSKLRVVFLAESARVWLKKYFNERGDLSPYCFVAHDRAKNGRAEHDAMPLTSRSIERMIKKYARASGITKNVTPHTLRHSFATDLLRNGADIRSVQAMLGHSSITTTQIYTHITDRGLRDVHKKFHDTKKDPTTKPL